MKIRFTRPFGSSLFTHLRALQPILICFQSAAFAADITWDGGLDGTGTDWTIVENWSGDLAPTDNISTDNAFFTTLTTGQPAVNAARSVAGVELQTITGGWTLGGTGTLTLGSKGIDAQTFESGTNTISVANIVMGSSSTSSWTLGASSVSTNTITDISSNIQVHETAQLQFNSARGGTGGTGTLNLAGIISNTTGKTASGQVKYLGGSASKNTVNVTGLNTYTGNTLISQAVVNFNSLADNGTASALGSSGIINVNENTSFSTLVYNGTSASSTNRRLTIGLAFAGNSGASNVTNNAATANTLSFTSTASVINGGSGNRQFVLNGSNTGNNTFAQSIDNATSGVTSFTKQNAGRWILTNANSNYTGVTTLAGGFLHVAKLSDGGVNSSIGAATNAASNLVFNGGELTYTGAGDSTDRLMSFAAGGNISNNGTGPLSFTNTGAITHSSATARSINLGGSNATDTNTFAPQIVDGAGAAITSISSRAGKWALTNTNTFTGGIVFGTASTTGGTLLFGADTALGASAGAITFTGSGNLVASGNATIGSARTITAASGRAANFGIISALGTQVVVNAKITGAGSVSRVSGSSFSTGSVRFSNDTNDYAGAFSTKYGVTEYTSIANSGVASALGAGTQVNADNSSSAAYFRYVGSSNSSTDRTINWSATTGQFNLESSGTGTLSVLSTVALVTGNGNKTFALGGTNAGDNVFSQAIQDGPVSGITSLEKHGTGKWILASTVTSTGNTTITAGTLALASGTTLGTSPALSIAAGAVLDLSAIPAAYQIPSTQTLTGAGSVSGQALDVSGTLAPGSNGVGTITTASVNFGATSDMNVQFDSAARTSDRLAVTGNLVIDSATVLSLTDVAVSPALVPNGVKLTLATYTGTVTGTFNGFPDGAAVVVGANNFTLAYNDGNAITLTSTNASDPYTSWIDGFGLAAADKDKTDDPDYDGVANGIEFLTNGNPNSPGDKGLIWVGTSGSQLVLSLAIRGSSTSFGGAPSPSATVDDITAKIQGSVELSVFTSSVSGISFVQPSGWSPTPPANHSYHSFKLDASTGLAGKGFLRLMAE